MKGRKREVKVVHGVNEKESSKEEVAALKWISERSCVCVISWHVNVS